ncbi:hypothetical protein [Mycolicibacterium setense]|uniref:Lipoprotein n=1 Tax=Mycolicibacterium setense TaxID=431269 RepID=A0ABR4YSE3_9MYCO|nr:hypothetical protein [Mycolicibacterium setense]KHO19293.1 hypothetical protein QQ25_21370 [Mycolicibacterium setense]KHO23981.1 hypothetical protein QQ44_17675 [Mycolicibacterium setense]MCV7113225.1 hypothetical protein [Mycolicibacterium setense]
MVVVGGAVVVSACSGGADGGGAVDIPMSSVVLTGVLGAVLEVMGVVDRDGGFVEVTGVSRSR